LVIYYDELGVEVCGRALSWSFGSSNTGRWH